VGTGFHPELTGRENMYLNGAILGMRREEVDRKFDEIVAFSGVEKFIDTPVKHYSSGMYLRLAFAVAAHLEPDILLVDEVLAVGDAEFQKKCLGKMSDVAGEGRTVLFVSHNMASVKRLCQTAYWLEGGTVRKHGPADDLVDDYERTVLEEIGSQWDGQTALVNEMYGLEVWNVEPTVITEDESTTLRIAINGKATRPMDRVGVNFTLATIQGTPIFRVGPQIAGTWMHDLDGDWKCVIEFKDITRHLAGGHYAINLVLHTTGKEVILRIDQAALIYLPMTDVYSSGVHFSQSRHGLVPLPFTFHHHKD
jgi:lipopolysaccharide transport system ATP-binding protein